MRVCAAVGKTAGLAGERPRSLAGNPARVAWPASFFVEFLWFGLKEARACLFAGLFFLRGVRDAAGRHAGRSALRHPAAHRAAIQAGMVWAKLETWDEAKAIAIFPRRRLRARAVQDVRRHRLVELSGLCVHQGVRRAAVLRLHVRGGGELHHPVVAAVRPADPPSSALLDGGLVALAIYANFFTHHYIRDCAGTSRRCALGLYARTTVVFRPLDRDRTCRCCWPSSSSGSSSGWPRTSAPSSASGDIPISWAPGPRCISGKWSSWSLLVVMTFTIVAKLKHIKERSTFPNEKNRVTSPDDPADPHRRPELRPRDGHVPAERHHLQRLHLPGLAGPGRGAARAGSRAPTWAAS